MFNNECGLMLLDSNPTYSSRCSGVIFVKIIIYCSLEKYISVLSFSKHPTSHNPDGCFCFNIFPLRLELEVLVVIFLSLKCTFDICLLFLFWLQCNKVTNTKYQLKESLLERSRAPLPSLPSSPIKHL